VYADGHDVDAALAHGRRLRAEIDDGVEPVGVLVVADGAHTLTPPAPGGYDPDSIPTQAALDDALAAGDAAALTRLPDTIVGRVAYQVLAGLTEPRSAKELYRGAPYGVGYFAGVWLPVGRSEATGVLTE
jgi:aromatic ring-opening dioxygenase LigB subunit